MVAGYTLIQQRFNAGIYFNRSWVDFQKGFGSPTGYYWIGNDRLYQLTNSGLTCSLRFDLWQASDEVWLYAYYSSFSVGNEAASYALSVSGQSV